MAKQSSVLGNIFGFFNVLFAIAGVAVIILAIILHVHVSNVQEFENAGGVVVLYVIGFITLGISFLGAYGAFRQVRWMLVVFLVLMCFGCLILIRIAVVLAIFQQKVNPTIEEELRKLPPLDNTSEDFQQIVNRFQENMQCCGVFNGYKDWERHVPLSCDCPSEDNRGAMDVCVALPQNTYMSFVFQPERSRRMVYSQACGPLFLNLVMNGYNGLMGFFFGLTTLTVLGIVLSSCLIAQINRNRRNAGVVLAPTLVFTTPGPMKYNKLVNEPYH
ncbi:hypothetical protein ACEWY4_007934 [Coilia grayii]|uniref:Tetraspanin n=1 Tax=Coilia grayii TaxID=363190 RepID=A0ABD1K9H0_9TELE